MSSTTLVTPAALQDFFREALEMAIQANDFRPAAVTAAYLVDLLCEYAVSGTRALEEPLGPVLVRAERSLPAHSAPQLKRVGDESLYVAGYFSDRLNRIQVNRSYYITLGRTAYGRLGRMLEVQGGVTRLVLVFSELESEFGSFVEVLSHVRHQDQSTPGVGH